MSAQCSKSEDKVDMSPKDIRFSQKSVDTKFRNGKPLKDTLEEILKNPECEIRKIPSIIVYLSSKGYYAANTGNRRLYLFKLLFEYKLIKLVPVFVTKNQKSKSTHESQETHCAQEKILRKTIERHLAAGPEVPEKDDENKAESSAASYSQGKVHQTRSQKRSRQDLENPNTSHESSKLPNSVEKVKKYKRGKTEVGKETSTPDGGLRQGLGKRKSPPTDLPDEEQSQRSIKAPMGVKVTETVPSPTKSFEDENKDSPKRRRLTPSSDQSLEIPLISATTGNSPETDDSTID